MDDFAEGVVLVAVVTTVVVAIANQTVTDASVVLALEFTTRAVTYM